MSNTVNPFVRWLFGTALLALLTIAVLVAIGLATHSQPVPVTPACPAGTVWNTYYQLCM